MYIVLDCLFIIFWLIELLSQFYFFIVCGGRGKHVENMDYFLES